MGEAGVASDEIENPRLGDLQHQGVAQRLGMSAVRLVQQQLGLTEALAGLQDVDHLLAALR